MNILYIASSFPREKEGLNLYTDLADEIAKKHNVTVIVAEEKKKIDKTSMQEERKIKVLRVKIGNMYQVSFIEKGITFIMMQRSLKKAIKKYLKNEKFDLILFMAPPVTFGSVVKYAMKKFNAKSYLMQKDIFPQNSIDLGIMSKRNPIYYYFKYKEKEMYKTASIIGCMSKGNIQYLLKRNKYLMEQKLEIFPNTIKLKTINDKKTNIREKYNIGKDIVLAMYGGNFGKPQGIEFIKKILREYKNNNQVMFFFSGRGTEKENLFNYIRENDFKNVIIQDFMHREDYVEILKETDIGLVFLDWKFTIPNIPSRTLSYLEYSIPIMAATDRNTDYKELLVDEAKAGLWCESNNIKEFKKNFDYLIENKKERITMGQNGRKYLEENFNVTRSIQILEKAYMKLNSKNQNGLN